MTELIACKAGSKCRAFGGPVQFAAKFASIKTDGRRRTYAYCLTCRIAKAQYKRALRLQNNPPKPKVEKYVELASNATITPQHRQELNRWLLGLVTRRTE